MNNKILLLGLTNVFLLLVHLRTCRFLVVWGLRNKSIKVFYYEKYVYPSYASVS